MTNIKNLKLNYEEVLNITSPYLVTICTNSWKKFTKSKFGKL